MSEIFEIEMIIFKNTFETGDYYLIKWDNFPYEESTWEPVQEINSLPVIVNEFKKRPPLEQLKVEMHACLTKQEKKAKKKEYKKLKRFVEKKIIDKEREIDAMTWEPIRTKKAALPVVKSPSLSSLKSESDKTYSISAKKNKAKRIGSKIDRVDIREEFRSVFLISYTPSTAENPISTIEVDYQKAIEEYPDAIAQYFEHKKVQLLGSKRPYF